MKELLLFLLLQKVQAQYQLFGLEIPGTEACLIDSLCYREKAAYLFSIVVLLPTASLLMFFFFTYMVHKRIRAVNLAAIQQLEIIQKMEHEKYLKEEQEKKEAQQAKYGRSKCIASGLTTLQAAQLVQQKYEPKRPKMKDLDDQNIDLEQPALPNYVVNEGYLMDDLQFQAHRENYKNILRIRKKKEKEQKVTEQVKKKARLDRIQEKTKSKARRKAIDQNPNTSAHAHNTLVDQIQKAVVAGTYESSESVSNLSDDYEDESFDSGLPVRASKRDTLAFLKGSSHLNTRTMTLRTQKSVRRDLALMRLRQIQMDKLQQEKAQLEAEQKDIQTVNGYFSSASIVAREQFLRIQSMMNHKQCASVNQSSLDDVSWNAQ